jgi:EAL domain-containing protein (putative c-di-GMP-specific phosphodiesterase class I)/GGDEF domain-containing protein
MEPANLQTRSAIARIIVARRAQLPIRVGFAVLMVATFHIYIGMTEAMQWAAVYLGLQVVEMAAFRSIDNATAVTRTTSFLFYAIMLTSSSVFTAFGLLEAYQGGVWGIACAGILWTGSIATAAIVSGESRGALTCSLLPPLLAFLTVPYFILSSGGSAGDSIAIVLAGLVNACGTLGMWSVYQRLLKSATKAREIGRLALIDSETGLPSRAAVQQRVVALLESRPTGIVVVAAINVDRFQHLRGAIGHAAIIDLMRRLAARLGRACDEAPLARLSSANFGFAFVARNVDDAHRMVARLQGAVATPVLLRDNRVDVSVTIGLSQPADAVASATEVSIIDRAMIAVDQARAARKQAAFFDATLYGNPGISLSLMSEMLRALDNGQMSLCYQPKYELRSGDIVGAEALVRWTHPEHGALRPDMFVQMAEETGHIAELTEWVLRRAVADQRTLHEAGLDVCLSVNWSGHLIDDIAFTDVALEITRHATGKLCLEVTETAIIGNARLARQTLERFRAAGLTISIDDYGSGLSSLAYLKNIPADELKIDKAFVMNMATDAVDAVLVRSAVSLAHSLGLCVVAEGVESEGALELLRAMGCDIAQGYLIARPMPLNDLATFLGTHAAENAARATAS